ncbi:hypothetical protein T4E_9364, partial [Trichinella pseudospiralis]
LQLLQARYMMKHCVISFLLHSSILMFYCFHHLIANNDEDELIENIMIAIQKRVNFILNDNYLWLLGNFTTAFKKENHYYLSFDMIKSTCMSFDDADPMLDGTYGIIFCDEFVPRQKRPCIYIVNTLNSITLYGACA